MQTGIESSDNAVGKQVGFRQYIHTSAVQYLPPEIAETLRRACNLAKRNVGDFNVVRFDHAAQVVGLLHYPNFFEEACPVLAQSWKVDVTTGSVSHRTYHESHNPPILHRKERLIAPDHPDQPRFAKLTTEFESLGLFSDPVQIGFKVQWERLLGSYGYRVIGNDLLPIGNDESEALETPLERSAPIEIARHLTALDRASLSAPVQSLLRHGLLDGGSLTVFDYGCGKGDEPLAHGLHAADRAIMMASAPFKSPRPSRRKRAIHAKRAS